MSVESIKVSRDQIARMTSDPNVIKAMERLFNIVSEIDSIKKEIESIKTRLSALEG